MSRHLEFTVTSEYDGEKTVYFLRKECGLSARLVASLKCVAGGITKNGEHVRTIDRIKTGDIIGVTIPDDKNLPEPLAADIDVIYEDNDILCINKSPFMAMHPSHNHQGDTLANAVAAYLANQGKSIAFRAAGRLDKGTSGVVVCALNKFAAAKLNGKIEKEYLAFVQGLLEGEGSIDVPIYRPDPMKTLRACSYELGTESALTHWKVEKSFENATLVRVKIETGRTHQIRVHFAFTGHPLAGDTMYGDFLPDAGHQLLHCEVCRFVHPVSGEEMVFRASLPETFEKILKKMK